MKIERFTCIESQTIFYHPETERKWFICLVFVQVESNEVLNLWFDIFDFFVRICWVNCSKQQINAIGDLMVDWTSSWKIQNQLAPLWNRIHFIPEKCIQPFEMKLENTFAEVHLWMAREAIFYDWNSIWNSLNELFWVWLLRQTHCRHSSLRVVKKTKTRPFERIVENGNGPHAMCEIFDTSSRGIGQEDSTSLPHLV